MYYDARMIEEKNKPRIACFRIRPTDAAKLRKMCKLSGLGSAAWWKLAVKRLAKSGKDSIGVQGRTTGNSN